MGFALKILDKKKFVLCFLNAFIVNMCIYLVPVALAFFTKGQFTIEKFAYLIITIGTLKLLEVIFNHFWIMYILKYENQYAKDLQIAYFKRITKMKPFKLNQIHNGFLKKQVDIIADESEQFMEYVFETVNGFIISSIIFLIQVIQQDKNMFYLCIGMLTGMVLYNLWLSKKYVKAQQEYNEEYSNYNATYVDFLQNIRTVKRLGAGKYAKKRNEQAFEKVLPKLDKINFFHSLRSNGINFFVYTMYILILINLYFQMKNGQDILSYILFYASIFSEMTGELKDLSRLFMHHNKFKAATTELEKMIGKEETQNTIDTWNEIAIRKLEFQYDKENEIVIKVPEFLVQKKDKISIVGRSGQGKTTFLNLFARYMEPEKGNYLVDGKEKKGNLDIGYISQESDLFNLSIRDNLCLGREILEENLLRLIEEAGLKDWINNLELGLDTIVGERGVKLSVGQKQRLNILRGILMEADIYILDEPTSNLDKETEKQIMYLIQKYLEEKTVLIVTHREEIKTICNKHYEFKDNVMIEENLVYAN